MQFYHVFLLFLDYWPILFYSCRYYTIFFNPIAELVIVLGIPSKEAKEKTERHPVIPETEIRKYLI